MKRFLFLLLSICLLGSKTFAQQYLQFTFPFERMVFQRESTNQATVYFSAQYTNPNSNSFGYTAQYRIQPLDLQNGNTLGSPTTWTNISFNNTAGFFRTMFVNIPNLNSGWYQLQIRMIDGSGVQRAINYRKFGVGDIFVIAGQSNSQGYEGAANNPNSDDSNIISYYTGSNYTDAQLPDAVNIYSNSVLDENDSKIITRSGTRVKSMDMFHKMQQNFIRIFPNGVNSWCYAVLGKDMQAVTQVPIMFFNAGAESTTIGNWIESIDGGSTYNRYTGGLYKEVSGLPYLGLRNTLQMFASIMGVRSILWHQGESDADQNAPNYDYYVQKMNQLIGQVEEDFKDENNNNIGNLTWYISQVSWYGADKNANYAGKKNQNLIDKQVSLVDNVNKKTGAITDVIEMKSNPNNTNDFTRAPDGQYNQNVHCSDYGLYLLGQKWLNAQVWNGNPIKSKPLLPITITQVSGGLYNLTAPLQPNGQYYAKYFWVKTGNSLTNYIGDSQTLENVNLYAGSITCYVSKSADPNEMNFFACQPVYMGLPNLGSPPCPTFLTYDSPNDDFLTTPSPIDQKANNVINATNAIKNNGTTVNYKAGKAIVLENGFKADASTIFKAEIIGCDNVPIQTWFSDNVGSGSGSSSLSSGVLSISGNGSLGGTNDNIHYYHSTYSGDVNIIAKIEGISTTDGHRAGIMIRNSIADNSGFYEFIIDGNGNVGKLKRKNAGDGAGFYGYAQCPTSGSWIKIEKTGNTIKCYFKPDDTYNWLEVIGWDDHTDNNFNSSFQIGFVAYSGASATFSNISVNGTPIN